MAVNLADDRLPCGHDIDQLWDHLAKGTPDEHARSCEYCQAALNEIRPLHTAISELAAEPVRPPADLSGRVMAAVRARISAAPRIALPGQAGNRLFISECAAAFILRAAATPSTAYAPAKCPLTPDAHDMSTSADLKLSISLRFDMPALAAARAVRIAVRHGRPRPARPHARPYRHRRGRRSRRLTGIGVEDRRNLENRVVDGQQVGHRTPWKFWQVFKDVVRTWIASASRWETRSLTRTGGLLIDACLTTPSPGDQANVQVGGSS